MPDRTGVLRGVPVSRSLDAVKRALDLLGGTAGLALVSPLLAVVALLIRLDTPGPVWFRQTRLGLNGRPFRIYKFRTMLDGSTHLGTGLETTCSRAR